VMNDTLEELETVRGDIETSLFLGQYAASGHKSYTELMTGHISFIDCIIRDVLRAEDNIKEF